MFCLCVLGGGLRDQLCSGPPKAPNTPWGLTSDPLKAFILNVEKPEVLFMQVADGWTPMLCQG